MSTASAYLTVRGIDVDVVYKDIKNLHIGVYPPVGRVRVAAPERLDDDAGPAGRRPATAVDQDASASSSSAAERQSEREMVTGESHYVWGVRLPAQGHRTTRPRRTSRSTATDCCSTCPPARTQHDRRERASIAGTATQLRERDPALIAKWEPIIGRTVPQLEHPPHEDQVGLLQPRDRPHLVQPRARQEAPRLPRVHRRPRTSLQSKISCRSALLPRPSQTRSSTTTLIQSRSGCLALGAVARPACLS